MRVIFVLYDSLVRGAMQCYGGKHVDTPQFQRFAERAVTFDSHFVGSLQIDYDDEVEYHGTRKLYDLARSPDDQPFFLTISFTHPHPPFVTGREHWDRYRHDEIDMPTVAPIPYEALDAHSQWLHVAHAQNIYDVTDAHVRNARHAYYGMVSYVDDKVGRILQVLDDCGLAQNTVVVFAADHGEMLGERGMWFKQTFFEWSVRVPLMIAAPGIAPRRLGAHVSLVDLLPTFLDLAGGGAPVEPAEALHGSSLVPLMTDDDDGSDRVVISEYSSEGVRAASRMVRRGKYKYVYTRGLVPMLFDLEADPLELRDLAGALHLAPLEAELRSLALKEWDPERVHAEILASQKRRRFISEVAERSGRYPNWAFQPYVDESKRYIRGSGAAGPTAVKGRARLPFVEPAKPDHAE